MTSPFGRTMLESRERIRTSMIRLSVPGTLLYRDLVLRVVASSCRLAHVSRDSSGDDFGEQVVSAVSEAFNNIAIHGYGDRDPGNVDFEISLADGHITIRLCDTGKSFNPEAIPAPDLAALPESHMGLFIIRSFMDEVSYVAGSAPDFINVLTLTKRF